jgi:hypothetical protein
VRAKASGQIGKGVQWGRDSSDDEYSSECDDREERASEDGCGDSDGGNESCFEDESHQDASRSKSKGEGRKGKRWRAGGNKSVSWKASIRAIHRGRFLRQFVHEWREVCWCMCLCARPRKCVRACGWVWDTLLLHASIRFDKQSPCLTASATVATRHCRSDTKDHSHNCCEIHLPLTVFAARGLSPAFRSRSAGAIISLNGACILCTTSAPPVPLVGCCRLYARQECHRVAFARRDSTAVFCTRPDTRMLVQLLRRLPPRPGVHANRTQRCAGTLTPYACVTARRRRSRAGDGVDTHTHTHTHTHTCTRLLAP